MKKNRLTIIIVIALLAIALFFYLNNSKGTIKKELRDFAVEDTASITKIFLVDKANHQVTLERKNHEWIVNKKFTARRDVINLLLKTIKRISVRAPVPKAAEDNIVKNLAVKSTKIEIYKDNDLIKTYYVGGPTQDQYGTYMLLKNSSRPFIMEIPGFRGYLSTRYFTFVNDWRSQIIFNKRYRNILSVTVKTPKEPNKSFKIIKSENNIIDLKDYKNQSVAKFDTLAAKQFLAHFIRINFNKFVENFKHKKDSILKTPPSYIITLEDVNKNKKTIKVYPMLSIGRTDSKGNALKYDPDNMYVFLNNDRDFVFAQYFVFDPILKNIDYFLAKKQLKR